MKKYPIGRAAAVLALAAFLTGMSSRIVSANPDTEGAWQQEKPQPTEFAHITSCAIEGGSQIAIRGQMEGTWSDPAVYDNYLYLFFFFSYQDNLEGRTDYCAWIT